MSRAVFGGRIGLVRGLLFGQSLKFQLPPRLVYVPEPLLRTLVYVTKLGLAFFIRGL